MKRVAVFAITLVLLAVFSSVRAEVIHSNNWDSGPATYQTRFGNLDIVSNPDGLNGNSLRFNTAGNDPDFYYDQIKYSIGDEYESTTKFQISFDLYVEDLIGTGNQFTILFDTPTVRNIYLTGSGTVNVKPGYSSEVIAGYFSELETLHFDIIFDMGENLWDISVNNTKIYSSIIDNTSSPFLTPAEQLRSIRFSHGLRSSISSANHSTNVYLDNVVISAVPVPGALLLFFSALLGLWLPGFRARFNSGQHE